MKSSFDEDNDENMMAKIVEQRSLMSGELYYHAVDYGNQYKSLHKDISDEFWNFLKVESHSEIMNQSCVSFKLIGDQTRVQLELKMNRYVNGIAESISIFKTKILSRVTTENSILTMKLASLQELFDANVMQLVLDYYAILKSELDATREQLAIERLDQQVLIKQAAVLRDIRLFTCHLMVETQGTIGLSLLTADSQQFVRCVKAVTDNINGDAFGLSLAATDHLKTTLRVQNVLKLQNSFLSGKLKASSEKVANGKVKGLFCCLSVEQFYKFASFGLYSQTGNSTAVRDIASTLFGTAWFCAKAPLGVPVTREVAHVGRVSGTALRLATAQTPDDKQHLRFSRYSTMSSIQGFNADQLEQGVFLALCRVLIVHQRTITTAITSPDVADAAAQNYDALYSSLTEEYVLLQPTFVLPEFFMHVQFPDVFGGKNGPSKSPSLKKSVVVNDTLTNVHPMLQNCPGSAPVDIGMRISALDLLARFGTVEELLLRNQMSARLKTEGLKNNEEMVSNGIISPHSPSKDSSGMSTSFVNSPRGNLLKKQHIVMQLQQLIKGFQVHSAELMRVHAEKVADSVNIHSLKVAS